MELNRSFPYLYPYILLSGELIGIDKLSIRSRDMEKILETIESLLSSELEALGFAKDSLFNLRLVERWLTTSPMTDAEVKCIASFALLPLRSRDFYVTAERPPRGAWQIVWVEQLRSF